MKFLPRAVIAALALSFAAIPAAQAQQHNPPKKPVVQFQQKTQAQKPPVVKKQTVAKKQKWARGQRVSDWKRKPAVKDYQRHGLRAPARGQQWVKIDNDYLLVSIATGVILGVTAASR
ncbi:RcnB family protein [Rhizobiaceae bacterium BDR2-2]|uniref:RcnB family protein n=1 Tax=Ectorhizobium quercum TaxID=2965071 RepID=A0AAE3MX98_9HYPH|nr:RcnB family protein [Ectorhizobium quercum]MCX8995971.1 RcnB family protein [Ectorhizobium quercum]